MILPMKKVSLLVLETEKDRALAELRQLGLVHLEAAPASGEKLSRLREDIAMLQRAMFTLAELKRKSEDQWQTQSQKALAMAVQIAALSEGKKECRSKISALGAELERLKAWGDMDPEALAALEHRGLCLRPCEMPRGDYERLPESVKTLYVNGDKKSVRFLAVDYVPPEEGEDPLAAAFVPLPAASAKALEVQLEEQKQLLAGLDRELSSYLYYTEAMAAAVRELEKELEFETFSAGMVEEVLKSEPEGTLAVSCLRGYIPAEDLPKLQAAAREKAWGLATADPDMEDNVPTKLRNNRFVSLIYPLTDFLGTVPGYFEYDISGWFLAFMLVFFGIIFGDGGYGLLIAGVAAVPIVKALLAKKPVAPIFWLMALLGGATVVWGALTCSWFGLAPEQLPQWLQNLSLPLISNVNADRLWYPFWTGGAVGLTTAQNLQILCFALALIQLSVAHVKGMIGNRKSLKFLGELGSLMQLWGMFYVVLSMVVNGQVFPLGLVIAGIPVGTVAIVLVAVGFALSFVFGSYEGSVKDSVLDSCKNIISILLGVVNVFSDIVSYIRLWAVGLAGAAISATVNEMAGPMLGRLSFILVAVFLLVFGHGLNMILNLLSVIVHGVRLNTLEFSSHLGMSWSGHKFEAFKE